jgi:micrococcal nuclease
MYEYRCELVRVVDGDTIDVDIDLGFACVLRKQRIRLFGINTPESRTRNLEEKKHGLAAKARVKELLAGAESIVVRTAIDKKARGKYGRILGTVFADDVDVNNQLVDEGHAVVYWGGPKRTDAWWAKEV